MTNRILTWLVPRPAPEDAASLREWRIAARIRELGDRERELNRWRDSYRLRTGRVA
jgi:hypothetical protein